VIKLLCLTGSRREKKKKIEKKYFMKKKKSPGSVTIDGLI